MKACRSGGKWRAGWADSGLTVSHRLSQLAVATRTVTQLSRQDSIKFISFEAFLEVYDAYLDAPSTLEAKKVNCGEMQWDCWPKSDQAGHFSIKMHIVDTLGHASTAACQARPNKLICLPYGE